MPDTMPAPTRAAAVPAAVPAAAMLTPNIGTAAQEERDRVGFTDLRAARRARAFAEMERLGLDALVLGREANVRYVAGSRRLWTASSRPFGPTAVAVRATGRVHLMTFSASYEGAPAEVPLEDVYCTSFNVGTLLASLNAIPGLRDATRVGVDGFTLFMRDLLPEVVPGAEIVPVEPELRALRRIKLPDEIAVMRTAAAIAEAALRAAADRIRPGVTEKDLQAAFLERMCTLGTSQFSQQGTFTVVDPPGRLRWVTSGRLLDEGDLVALAGGALWAGYEGTLARTWRCGTRTVASPAQRALLSRWRGATDAVVDACRPGATGEDLVAAHERAGEPVPRMPIVYAVGLGHEGPIAGSAHGVDFDRRQVLEAGMVVAVRSFVTGPAGGVLGEDMVLVGPDGPERITTLGHGPLDA
jgi:Xaa-Pro dipeptidase